MRMRMSHLTFKQVCDGQPDCKDKDNRSDYFKLHNLFDFSDEDSAYCNNCTGLGLSLCTDQRTCVHDKVRCDGEADCYDVSDELAENCDLCQRDLVFRCVFEGLDR